MNIEQKLINFNYDREMKDGEEVIFFRLDTYPTVKFRYDNIRFGTPDEDIMVPVMYDLDIAHLKENDEVQLGDDFSNQVQGLLAHLIESAYNRAANIINDQEIEGLTTQDSPAIMPLTEQDETRRNKTKQNKTKRNKQKQDGMGNGQE